MKTDIVIVGCGVSGLYCALSLPRDKNIVIVTKSKAEESDSFLAQGGICVMRDDADYEPYFEDTMRAGHYENNKQSVHIMLTESRAVISDLIKIGTDFEKRDGKYVYTKEGAHSAPRILYHADETGKEITSKLLAAVKKLSNITLIEGFNVVDIIRENGEAHGVIGYDKNGDYTAVSADYTVLATGGIGGLFAHSTNFPHLTGDALAISLKHGIKLKDIDYIQIHPTTLYTKEQGRAFLISESVRGEGAILLNHKGQRFVDELLPRDVVSRAIFAEMEKEGKEHMWLSMSPIPEDEIKSHFKNIYAHCLKAGYDVTKEPIPVVPSQHYFMGGIDVNEHSKTNMPRLYAVGETACNGVHGKNRLASNSLLESLVFAKRAARDIANGYTEIECTPINFDKNSYKNHENEYKTLVLNAIEEEKKKR